MQARVKADHKWYDVKVSGHEFVKGEFQEVPEALEAAVLDHPYLDVAEGHAPAKKVKKEVAPSAPEMIEGEGTGETNTAVDGDKLTTDQTPTTPAPEKTPAGKKTPEEKAAFAEKMRLAKEAKKAGGK